jgi:hypothetical protein
VNSVKNSIGEKYFPRWGREVWSLQKLAPVYNGTPTRTTIFRHSFLFFSELGITTKQISHKCKRKVKTTKKLKNVI